MISGIMHRAGLYYETAGAGHPLVLLHGGLVDSRMWDEQFDVLGHEYLTVRYDSRGNGRSAMPHAAYADHQDLCELLAFLGIERTYLLGSSGGAALAIDFTLQHPELVEAIILTSPGVSGYRWSAETLQAATEFLEHWAAGNLTEAVEARLRMLTDGPYRTPEQLDQGVRKRVGAMTAHALGLPRADVVSQPLDPPAIVRLSGLSVPTLIIVGDQDVPEILQVASVLEVGIRGATKHVIAEAAHMVNMERPAEFNELVLRFLQETDKAPAP